MLFLSVILPLIGVGLWVGGIVATVWQRRRFARMEPAEGEVVGLERQVVNPGRPGIYCPVVHFSTTSGEVVEFQSEHGSRPARHKVGQRVKVLYDPADPHNAEIDSALARWLVPGIIFAIGAIFMCGGCMTIVFYLMVESGL